MTEPDDLFSVPVDEPAPVPAGALGKVFHFAELARAGRIAALEALEMAEAEVREYLGRQAAVREAEVRQNREGRVSANPRPTSASAASRVAPRSGSQRAKILTFIVEREGSTDFEIVEGLGLLENSARARRSELQADGFICDSGRVRQHRGSSWVVWGPTAEGRAWYSQQNRGAA